MFISTRQNTFCAISVANFFRLTELSFPFLSFWGTAKQGDFRQIPSFRFAVADIGYAAIFDKIFAVFGAQLRVAIHDNFRQFVPPPQSASPRYPRGVFRQS